MKAKSAEEYLKGMDKDELKAVQKEYIRRWLQTQERELIDSLATTLLFMHRDDFFTEHVQIKFKQELPRIMHWRGLRDDTKLHDEKTCWFCIDLVREQKKWELEQAKENVVRRL